MVQPSSLAFSSVELKDMCDRCSLTTLCQFPPLFSAHLARARQDPELLLALQGLRSVVLVGMALGKGDLDWCAEKGICLQVHIRFQDIC